MTQQEALRRAIARLSKDTDAIWTIIEGGGLDAQTRMAVEPDARNLHDTVESLLSRVGLDGQKLEELRRVLDATPSRI